MTVKDKRKSYLLEAVKSALSLDDRSDFEIAKAVGCVSVGTVANIRKSKHIPSVAVCERLYEELTGCSLKDFDL